MVKIECPKCGQTVDVPEGIDHCPLCGELWIIFWSKDEVVIAVGDV